MNGKNKELFLVDTDTKETIGLGKVIFLKDTVVRKNILGKYYEHDTMELFIKTEAYDLDDKPSYFFPIKSVRYNGPATIVFFTDGEKEVVKRANYLNENEDDRELAILYCILKHAFQGRKWGRELSYFRKELEAAGGKIDLATEKAFIKSQVKRMHPPYLDQISLILSRMEELFQGTGFLEKLVRPRLYDHRKDGKVDFDG